MRKYLIIALILLQILPFSPAGGKAVSADVQYYFPIKVGIVIDEANPSTGSTSALFLSVIRLLTFNKIPFDILDISQGQHHNFIDSANNPKYSVILLHTSGYRVDAENSAMLIHAADRGTGLVGLLPDSVNPALKDLFGISTPGLQWGNSTGLLITADEFTVHYAGMTIEQASIFLHHIQEPEVNIFARFLPGEEPAIWTYRYGTAKTVFHNTSLTPTWTYQGILLQSILYAMPVGVAMPVNAGVIEVDDCPRTYYSYQELSEFYYNFVENFLGWLDVYNLTTTLFTAFSYTGNIDDFWVNPEPLECARRFLSAGHEIGLHCGSTHLPLSMDYWGTEENIDAETGLMTTHLRILQDELAAFGVILGDTVSYVAPMNEIGPYGYQSLDTGTDIRYVGTDHMQSLIGTDILSTEDITRYFIRHHISGEEVILEGKAEPSADGYRTTTLETSANSTFRDFGWEPGTDIYNLPRVAGDFYYFDTPGTVENYNYWALLRSHLESGQPYLIFTHPDEHLLVDPIKYPNATMPQVFEAYVSFADVVATDYSYYRWWTASQLGDFLSTRSGFMDARWIPGENRLEILYQPDEAIQVKTQLYLTDISLTDAFINLYLALDPTGYSSSEFDILEKGDNYFTYPSGSTNSCAQMPSEPFQFTLVDTNRAPQLVPIDDKTVISGYPVTFLVSANDPDLDQLFYSALNLPAGATFDAESQRFTWVPDVSGHFTGIRFEVSDGTLTDHEDISITVLECTGNQQISEITLTVASGEDDGFSGAWYYGTSDSFCLAGNSGVPYNTWLRFPSVTIPRCSIIQEAYIETVHVQWQEGTALRIGAEKAANPSYPSNTLDHGQRYRTAGVSWLTGFSDYGWHRSPDLSAVIQELVDAYDYSLGAAMQLLIDDAGSVNGTYSMTSLEYGTPPRLYLRYSYCDSLLINPAESSITGVVREADGNMLAGATVSLDGETEVTTCETGTYELTAMETGSHSVIVSKPGWRYESQTIEVTEAGDVYTLDFIGVNGLIPDAPDLSYVLTCINKWIYPPSDGTGLDLSKVLAVINAWKYPN